MNPRRLDAVVVKIERISSCPRCTTPFTSITASGANSSTTGSNRPLSPLALYRATRSRIDSRAISSSSVTPPLLRTEAPAQPVDRSRRPFVGWERPFVVLEGAVVAARVVAGIALGRLVRGVVVAVALAAAVTGPVVALWWGLARRRAFGTVAEQAVYEVLHLASEAAPPFRSGLTVAAASRAVRSLRRLLGSEALAITDRSTVLAWDGGGEHHRHDVLTMARRVLDGGSPVILGPDDLRCGERDCPVRAGIVVPIESDGAVVGTLAAFGSTVRASTTRAATEVAGWVATQVELGRLDQTEARVGGRRAAGPARPDLARTSSATR